MPTSQFRGNTLEERRDDEIKGGCEVFQPRAPLGAETEECQKWLGDPFCGEGGRTVGVQFMDLRKTAATICGVCTSDKASHTSL